MLHPRAGHSDKVSAATDFEYRVWTQYMLSADDFGLMPCEAICLQADNRALAKKPAKAVQKALERLLDINLLVAYQDPQGRRYVCDPVWQKYQHIEYPKQSINPPPPDAVLEQLHPLTQELFRQCFGKKSARFRLKVADSSPNSSREVGDDLTLRAPARAETAKANGSRQEADGKGDPDDSSALRVLDAFRARWKATYGHDSSLLLKPLDHMQLQQQIGAHSEAKLLLAVGAYFESTDEYARKAKHPLALWLREPLRYLVKDAADGARQSRCAHQPRCADDAEHTRRDMDDRRRAS